MDKRFGLKTNCIADIINVLKLQPQVEEALIFGSRAMGTYKNGSDIDIALKGEKITFDIIATIRLRLDKLPYLYMYDIIDYKKISNPAVTAHIDELGITFYKKEEKPKEWKTYTLSNLINVKHGFAFKGEYFSEEPTNDILLSPGNFKIGGGFKSDKFKYYNGEFPKDYILKEGDILITMTDLSKAGDTLGYSAKIPPHNGINYLHNQRLGLVQFKNDEIDPDFLYWILRTKPYQYYIVGSATGSTVKHTSPTRICSYEFEAPIDKEKQQEIAQILTSLDDKIELNLQMNQTLEAMAQALFREWFVNFNFPNFDGVLENGLPKGWRKCQVKDICEANSSTLNSKDTISEVHYIEISEVDRGMINNISVYKRGEEPSRAKRKLKHGDTVLSTVRPNRGSYFLSLFPSENLIASTGFAVFSPTKVPFSFLYIFLTNDDQLEFYGKMADGAAYPAINQSVIMNMEIILPTAELLERYQDVSSNLMIRIYENLEANKILTQTRDTLLPKLMSGKIEIRN